MADDECKVSAVNVADKGSYLIKVLGYSRGKELFNNGEYTSSAPFSVGGHDWVVRYYPNGDLPKHADATAVRLVLDSPDAKNVKVRAMFSILDKDGLPVQQLARDAVFSCKDSAFVYTLNRAALEGSAYLIHDCLTISCHLTLTLTLTLTGHVAGEQFVEVPPSDLHLHFGNLLETMDGADVAFLVGGDKFSAHRLVLAARSSVFKAELLGAMKEKTDSLIEIHEMEPHVFKSLLHFLYTDSLPPHLEMDSNQDVVMARHLLVAADRYNVERLKLICEHKLCSRIDAGMVATSLALAEQHSCNGLKEACLKFLASPSNLEAMMASDGYEHLKSSCPSALKELIARLLPAKMKAAKDIVMAL